MHGITETITGWIGDYGLYGIFMLMLVDAVLPAASELVMVYGGALAAGAFAGYTPTLFGLEIESTAWGYVAVALTGTFGYLAGSVLGWAIGLYGGRPLLEQHGKWFHLNAERLERAERWFDRYDDAAVFVGRMLPVVRSFVSIPAGVMEVPFWRYTVLTFLGTIPWCFGLAAVGVAVGANWERFHHDWRYADYAILAALFAAVVYLVLRRLRRRAREGAVESG
ncbi:MAG TPA: DedA family protein [Gaiellaceae bacterium]|nr:DedA family protein [Gaiellaceae bacterium]